MNYMTITKCNLIALLLSHSIITISVLHKTPALGAWAGLFGFLVSCIALGLGHTVWKHTGK
jgi:hypothetical protein